MDDNPYQSPRSTGGGHVRRPVVSSLGLLADGVFLFVVGGTLLNISYASRTVAIVPYTVGALLIGLSVICFLVPITRWLRGR